MINGDGKKGVFEDHGWDIPVEGKPGLVTKKDNKDKKSVLSLIEPYLTIPIHVEVKELFVPSQQRFAVTMQLWERSSTNDDGHFVLKNVDDSALKFGKKHGIDNTLLYANDNGMSIGMESPNVTIPVPVLTDGISFNITIKVVEGLGTI